MSTDQRTADLVKESVTQHTEIERLQAENCALLAQLADGEKKLRELCMAHGSALIRIHDLEKNLATAKQEVWDQVKAEVQKYPQLHCFVRSKFPGNALVEWVDQEAARGSEKPHGEVKSRE